MNLNTVQQSMHKRAIEIGWDTPILKMLSIARKVFGPPPPPDWSKPMPPPPPDWSKPMPPPTHEPSHSMEEDLLTHVFQENAKLRREKIIRQEADKLYGLVKPKALEDPEKLKAEEAKAVAEAANRKKWDDFHKRMDAFDARMTAWEKRREEEKLLASAQGPQLTREQSERLQKRVAQVIALHKMRPDHTKAVLHGGKSGIRTSNDRKFMQQHSDLKNFNKGVVKQ